MGRMPYRTALPMLAASVLLLSACAGPAGRMGVGVGVGVPVGPVSVGVGLGSGGLSAGVGTGMGPFGVGVGMHQNGQVTGHAGVGASAPLGGARVGAGLGASTVLHEAVPPSAEPLTPDRPAQWRDAQGRVVPECQTRGGC